MVDASDIFHDSLPLAPERPATVFLSYKRGDVEEVQALQQWLKIYGVRVWRDLTDMPVGGPSEDEVVRAIEQESDAFVLYVTPACLESNFIWDIEVPAALRRWERDRAFNIIPIFQSTTTVELQRVCAARSLPSLTRFNGIFLSGTAKADEKAFTKELREIARRVLKAAIGLRLRRVRADRNRNYEPTLCLKTFPYEPPASSLDLDLDWTDLFEGKAGVPSETTWRDILLPALEDVKNVLSERVPSRRLHVYVQALLPAAFAFGFAFPETAHFTLLVEGRHGTWSTEGFPSTSAPLTYLSYPEAGNKQVALVEIAISRATASAVMQLLSALPLSFSHHLRFEPLKGPDNYTAVENADQALAMARQIGRELRRLCDTKGISHIHLFASLPAALAIMVGHEFNATCAITLYHLAPGKGYINVCTLGAGATETPA